MKLKIKISKKLVFHLVLYTALAGITMIFDMYLKNNPEALVELKECNEEPESEQRVVYLFSQSNTFIAKSPVQKTTSRKLFAHEHVKFLQKCHQLQNHQALKAESKMLRKPFYLLCHNHLFRQNYFTLPDDEPLIS